MTIFLLLALGLFFVSIIQFTYETLAICCIIYLTLIPLSVYNYNKKLKSTKKDFVEEDQRDIL